MRFLDRAEPPNERGNYPFTIEVTVPLRTDLGQAQRAPEKFAGIPDHRNEVTQVGHGLIVSEESDVCIEGETHFHLHVWWRALGDGDPYGCDLCAVLYDDARVWSAYLGEADVA